MATLHVTEAELVSDVHAVLDRIGQCDQVVIEREGLPPLALVHARDRGSRPIDKILSDPELLNSTVTLDPDFGKDLEEIIAMNRAPCRLTPLE